MQTHHRAACTWPALQQFLREQQAQADARAAEFQKSSDEILAHNYRPDRVKAQRYLAAARARLQHTGGARHAG